METASISEVKNGLNAHLRKVQAGETVLIYDRDEPVAKLSKIEFSDDPRLAKLGPDPSPSWGAYSG